MVSRFRWRAESLLLSIVAATGCSNQPGALKMEVTPAKTEFDADEPIDLSVTLRAGNSPICLSKARKFRFEVNRVGQKSPIAGDINNNYARCGTGILDSLILFPYLWAFAWLDVADAANRFHVLKAKDSIVHQFCLREDSVQLPELSDKGYVQYVRSPIQLGPGEYDVRIVLYNERASCGDFLPLPIGWQLYNQPTEATARVVVKPASTAAGQSKPTTRNP